MVTSEPQLLALFESCGFDFAATVRDIAVRFPQELDWGVPSSLVLPFQLTQSFAGFGPIWKVPVNREVDFDLPPATYFYEFHPTGDMKTNFDRAVGQLTPVLGEGQVTSASNASERTWRIGLFTIRVIAWPKEKNAMYTNAYEGHNPYLWIDAKIYVRPDFPFAHPTEDAVQPLHELFTSAPGYTLVCESPVYTRRNRVAGARDTVVVGTRDDALIIRAEDRSVRIPVGEIQQVVLTRLTPAQFSGSSSLSLNVLFLGRHQVSVAIANGDETGSLDRVAPILAAAVAKPLTITEYPDVK
jgi:hypothetical protein